MTSRGTKYWDSGAIPLIGPDILGDIIATLADLAIVISPTGTILSVLANPTHRNFEALKEWERNDIRAHLTLESVEKFDRALSEFLTRKPTLRPLELNHADAQKKWQFPIVYTMHAIGPDDTILLLGRDMRPVAEMQQQLVKAQIALERDYESQREFDTRFQVLLGNVTDAIAFISKSDGTITELNAAAARLLGKKREALLGHPLSQEVRGISRAQLTEALTTVAHDETSGGLELEALRSGLPLRVFPVAFRAAGERLFLCRLERADGKAPRQDDATRALVALFQSGTDAIVMTDREGAITSVNEAFLNLVDATDGRSLKGRQIAEFLSRGEVDQKVLMEHAESSGSMRLYTTRIVGEYGAQRPITAAVTYLADGTAPCFAFVLRDAQIVEAAPGPGRPATEVDPTQLMELVGSVALKDIVAQTTDVIERMCIETAIELTNNNRVAAADMLGLSRQSLYVKLRKYDLLAR